MVNGLKRGSLSWGLPLWRGATLSLDGDLPHWIDAFSSATTAIEIDFIEFTEEEL